MPQSRRPVRGKVTDDHDIFELDEMAIKAITRKMGDDLNEMLKRHEEVIHNGDDCREERVNCIAYLAHRVGIRDRDSVRWLVLRIADYEDFHHEHVHEDKTDS